MDEQAWSAAARTEQERDAIRATTATFLATLRANYGSMTQAQPEDQLKAPVGDLVAVVGRLTGQPVVYRTETRVDGIAGRPDLGFDLDGLPIGNIELKAPGLGADPARFRDKRSRDQWERFKALPNLIYTDGESWALYRSGDRVGPIVSLSTSVMYGDEAAPDWAVDELLGLLSEFFHWQPVIPSSARALAALLAPVTRLLRDEVLADVQEHGVLASLAREWRATLFPDATDAEFADGYAQTFTYALLLAQLEGAVDPLTAETAANELDADHALLGQALRVLGQRDVRQALSLPVPLMERLIGAVDATKLTAGPDPWLYFYEDFLAEYDPTQRNDRGVYYTPVQVVGFQVRTAHSVLRRQLGRADGLADETVRVLDPAAGTGTYPLAVAALVVGEAVAAGGAGLSAEVATRLGQNLYAFEILVGPYAVTHLRLSRSLTDAHGTLPSPGVNVFLTDTLAEPAHEGFAAQMNLFERRLAEEQERASRVKSPESAITVVMGNPPYDRDASGASQHTRKGGMVRHSTSHGDQPLIQGFLEPLPVRTRGEQAMNLYNDYVYFWRWAVWKVCDQRDGAGIVSYITPNAFLDGAGFGGMREVLRREFDEVWVVDLGGDGRALDDDNVFDIRTPVCITIAVRYPDSRHSTAAAAVRYRRITGTRAEKYAALDAETDLTPGALWRDAAADWQASFVPTSGGAYGTWPELDRLMPWSSRGMQFSRTWPAAETRELLAARWNELVSAPPSGRAVLLHESRDSTVVATPRSFLTGQRLPRLDSLDAGTQPDGYRRIAFRSFDRQWALADYRLIDLPRPALWRVLGDRQVYFTTIGKGCSSGPALIANAFVPDLNAFNNRGGRCWPAFRDQATTAPNVNAAAVDVLRRQVRTTVTGEELIAYIYGLLGAPAFTSVYADHFAADDLRIPLTTNANLFDAVARLGLLQVWITTFGTRRLEVSGTDALPERLPRSRAQVVTAIQGPADPYPREFTYDPDTQTLHVGAGEVRPIEPAAWAYNVSGYPIIESWLRYRMATRAGNASSPLDALRPERWTLSGELLEIIAAVEQLLDMAPEADRLLHLVLEGELITETEVPAPTPQEIDEPPRVQTHPALDLDLG